MNENMFEDFSRAGYKRTLVNQNSISQLKLYNFPKWIEMDGGDHAITINDSTVNVYTPLDCERFSTEMNYFSLIAVYHQGIGFEKEEIINGFHDIIKEPFFLPYAYKQDKYIDYFFVRNQNEAMRELIKNKLQILVGEWRLPLLIKANVCASSDSHIRPKKCMNNYLKRKVRECSSLGTLDLSHIHKEPEFVDMCFSLKNKGVCVMFFDEINSKEGIKSNSNFCALKMCGNEIQSLEHFKRLYDVKNFRILDLSKNNITDMKEFYNLKEYNLNDLILNDNPCCNLTQFETTIQKILPKLKMINSKILFNVQNPMNSIQNGNKEITDIGDGILIKADNLMKFRNRIEKLVNEKYWTHVTLLHNKRFTVQEIMKELSSNLLREVHFYPCYLKRLDNRDEFFLYRNFDALRILFMNGLKIQMPKNSFTVDVQIRLNVAEFKEGEVNWSSKIVKALTTRISEGVLDLNDFPRDPEFSKLTVLLNSSKTLDFVLNLPKRHNHVITRINAENCNISNCKGFECLLSFQKLETLNLRNNSIKSLEDFSKCSSIREVYLDGNPVCNKSPFEYIEHVRANFKHVSYIDGHRVFARNCIVTHQNFIINENIYVIVNAFVDYFFHLWDSFERLKVMQLYNASSIFTMSVNYEYNDKISTLTFPQIYPRIQEHVKLHRNLLKVSNMNNMGSNVHIGTSNIEMVFGGMCRTMHDFSTFTIDVPFYSEDQRKIGLIVTGVFEEFLNDGDNNSLPYSFSRTFLFDVVDGSFIIKNDQLLLRQPTVAQMEVLKNGNRITTKDEIRQHFRELLPSEFKNQALKLAVFQKLTECSKNYSKKLLQDSSWDLKVALACFNNFLEKNEIPDDQFKFK